MTSVGYATLDIIPSFKGVTGAVERELVPQAAAAGRAAGAKLGTAVSSEASAVTRKSNIFHNIEAGAATSGVGVGKRFGTALHETLGEYAKTIGAATVGFFAAEKAKEFFTSLIDEGEQAARTQRITESVLKATGEAAHVSAAHVEELAQSLGKMAGLDNDTVAAGENLLLTFKNVRNEAGKSNDIFDQATKTALDLSTALGQPLNSSVRILGRALNDPVNGLTMLTRVGISFTDQQKAQIKALATSGHMLEAQKEVLGELEGRFGGAAAAGVTGTQRLQAAWKDFEENLGTKALPIIDATAAGLTNGLIPALDDTIKVVGAIPGPVKAVAGAFALLKISQGLGFGTFIAGQAAKAGSALDSLRLRMMIAKDEYTVLNQGTMEFTGNVGRIVQPVSKAEAALGGLKAGMAGLGAEASGVLDFFGGPWGVAFIAATTVVTSFLSEQAKAKAQVQALTDSLDQQTGALTKNTKIQLFKNLQDTGAIDAAKTLGLNLRSVGDAAIHGGPALDRLRSQLSAIAAETTGQGPTPQAAAAQKLLDSISTQNNAIKSSQQALKDQSQFLDTSAKSSGHAAQATDGVTRSTKQYTGSLQDARRALEQLENAQNKQRSKNLQAAQDRLSLAEQLQTTASQASGKAGVGQGVGDTTKAAQANKQALIDLANQFANSAPRISGSLKVYDEVRKAFIADAVQMGATRVEAKKLADQWLHMPKSAATRYSTPGVEEALKKIREIRALTKASQNLAINVSTHEAGDPRLVGHNAQGTDFWRGGPTWVGEKGPELVTLPRGSKVIPNDKIGAGVTINVGTVQAHNYQDFMTQMHQRSIRTGGGGIDF